MGSGAAGARARGVLWDDSMASSGLTHCLTMPALVQYYCPMLSHMRLQIGFRSVVVITFTSHMRLQTSLASTHKVPGETIKEVCTHGQMFLRGRNPAWLETIAADKVSLGEGGVKYQLGAKIPGFICASNSEAIGRSLNLCPFSPAAIWGAQQDQTLRG